MQDNYRVVVSCMSLFASFCFSQIDADFIRRYFDCAQYKFLADKKNQRLSAFFICVDQREIIVWFFVSRRLLFLADERRFDSQILADKKNQRLSAFFICVDQREIIVCLVFSFSQIDKAKQKNSKQC